MRDKCGCRYLILKYKSWTWLYLIILFFRINILFNKNDNNKKSIENKLNKFKIIKRLSGAI